MGGVETLFKDSSDTVVEYANNAYKTAGLSANDYMATVTSFSASLLQSLGGDTAAAADMAFNGGLTCAVLVSQRVIGAKGFGQK